MSVTKLVILKAVEVVFEGGQRELLMPSDEPQSVPKSDVNDLIERKLAQKPGTKSRKKAAPKAPAKPKQSAETEGQDDADSVDEQTESVDGDTEDGDSGATEDDDQASGAE